MPDFQLTEFQEKTKSEAAGFARKFILPRLDEIEKTDEPPIDIWKAMSQPP